MAMPPVLCMIGGKWTTFRSFGELAADMALERLGRYRRVETTDACHRRRAAISRRIPQHWIARLAAEPGFA